jgi:hypothetical protein
MSKQSPFYKTGISRSPLNTHKPGHRPSIINTPDPTTLTQKKVDKARGLMKSFSGGKYQATRLDIHRDAPKQRGVVKPKVSAPILTDHKMIKSKAPIDPERTKVTYDKKKVKWDTKSDDKKHKTIL